MKSHEDRAGEDWRIAVRNPRHDQTLTHCNLDQAKECRNGPGATLASSSFGSSQVWAYAFKGMSAFFRWPPEGHVVLTFRPDDEDRCTVSVHKTFLHFTAESSAPPIPPPCSGRAGSAPPCTGRARAAHEGRRSEDGVENARGTRATVVALQLETMLPVTKPSVTAPDMRAMGTLELHAAGRCEPCRFYFGVARLSVVFLVFFASAFLRVVS